MNQETIWRDMLQGLIEECWPDWTVVDKIGRGTFGYVFHCVKESGGVESHQAVKIIAIEAIEAFAKQAKSDGVTLEEYLREQKERAVAEITAMTKLSSPHVVHINDFTVAEKEGNYYILIRMDLLKCLSEFEETHLEDTPEEAEAFARSVAKDILEALEVCEKQNVIHRDIKPENIFADANGNFLLGDFGLAKELGNINTTMTYTGTEEYIAPEIRMRKYNKLADFCSFGLVLYRLVNHWRAPFMPAYPEKIKASFRDEAQTKRLTGEQIPLPDNCSKEFGDIILKLCAYKPKDRFQNVSEVYEALNGMPLRKTEHLLPEENKPLETEKSESPESTPVNRIEKEKPENRSEEKEEKPHVVPQAARIEKEKPENRSEEKEEKPHVVPQAVRIEKEKPEKRSEKKEEKPRVVPQTVRIEEKKLKKKKSLAVILVPLLLICGVWFGINLWNNRTKSFDPFDYLDVSYRGVNGRGGAVLICDSDQISEDLEKELGNDALRFTVEPGEGLSNGSEITVTATISEDIAKEQHVALSQDTKVYTVEGLPKLTQVDVFERVTVSFSGANGYGTVTVKNASMDPFISQVNFSVKDNGKLSNGDTAVITASYDEELELKELKTAKTLTMEVPVEGLMTYLTSFDQLTTEYEAELEERAKDIIRRELLGKENMNNWANTARVDNPMIQASYDGTATITDFTLVEEFLGTRKKMEGGKVNNFVILAYAVTGKDPAGTTSFFYLVKFDELTADDDGTFHVDYTNTAGEIKNWRDSSKNGAALLTAIENTYTKEYNLISRTSFD